MKNAKTNGLFEKVVKKYEDLIYRKEQEIKDFSPKEQWKTRPHQMSTEIHFQQIKLAIFSARLNIIIASYSKGDDKNSLRRQFSQAVRVMEKVWDKRIVKMHLGRKQKEIDVYYITHTFYMRWMYIKVYHDRKQEEIDQYRLKPHVYMLRILSLGVNQSNYGAKDIPIPRSL